MFRSYSNQADYIVASFPEVSDNRIDKSHWDLLCTTCKVVRGFQVTKRVNRFFGTEYNVRQEDRAAATCYFFKCPVCGSFKQWIVFEIAFERDSRTEKDQQGVPLKETYNRYFRVTSLPPEGLEEIAELPAEPPALREAYRQAIRASDANAHIAAAAMFRRAVQVITRDFLGAKPATLAAELKEVIGKTYDGVTITQSFADVGYIIKEAGNQGAHPDVDPDLLSFTAADAADLQKIFMELVTDLFVVPAAVRKTRADFLKRRKIGNN